MANYKKSGGFAAGAVALLVVVALVLIYVGISYFKGTWNPAEWTGQIQGGELNIDDDTDQEDPDEDITDPEGPGEDVTDPEEPNEDSDPDDGPGTPEDTGTTEADYVNTSLSVKNLSVYSYEYTGVLNAVHVTADDIVNGSMIIINEVDKGDYTFAAGSSYKMTVDDNIGNIPAEWGCWFQPLQRPVDTFTLIDGEAEFTLTVEALYIFCNITSDNATINLDFTLTLERLPDSEPEEPEEPAGDEEELFSIGGTALTQSGQNFTFSATDETKYVVYSQANLSAATISVNFDISADFPTPPLMTPIFISYNVDSVFCPKDCYETAIPAIYRAYLPFLLAAQNYYDEGIPLCVITFEDSDITFGILFDVSELIDALTETS